MASDGDSSSPQSADSVMAAHPRRKGLLVVLALVIGATLLQRFLYGPNGVVFTSRLQLGKKMAHKKIDVVLFLLRYSVICCVDTGAAARHRGDARCGVGT